MDFENHHQKSEINKYSWILKIKGGFNVNYIEIDFNKVKGFNKLTLEQQQLFIEIYKVHNSVHGLEYKQDWVPVSVKWIVENPIKYSYLKVVFRNGDWLHYTKKHEWY